MKTTIGAMALVLFATTSGAQQLPATSAFIQNANHIFLENMAALGVPQPPGLQPRVITFIQDAVASHAAYRVTIDYEGFDGQTHRPAGSAPALERSLFAWLRWTHRRYWRRAA